ncbi:MAG: hydroxymyristoyl-ACP dehydratase [Legionella sp.]|nr:hydroxymyristoyl-ACP dehydratase [Legionella sp.]
MRFLFVDRIVELVPGELVRGIKHITRDDPYLCKDEDGQYCFISSLIGESLGQLAAWNVMATNNFSQRPVAGVVASACLHRGAYVGETLLLESFIDCLDESAVQYHSIARVGHETVFTVEGALGPLLPMSQFISDEDVRCQFVEINRPGDWSLVSQREQAGAPISSTQFSFSPVPMLFDRILHQEPGVSMTAEKLISRSAPFFPDHFPNNPVLPMTVLLECKLNLARLFLERAAFPVAYHVKELRKIKMNGFVHPGDILQCHVNVLEQTSEQLILRYRSEVDGKRVCVVDIVMMRKS